MLSDGDIYRQIVQLVTATMDPTGIPGLTIAVFDQLLKLGERTHQFISDARALDEVRKLYSRISIPRGDGCRRKPLYKAY